MRLGMIVRADFGRGLAQQTKSFYDHLKPDVTVCVDMSPTSPNFAFAQDFTAYPDAIVTGWRGYTAPFQKPDALNALAECDIVYSAETYYDERLPRLTKTILHVNPEFWRDQPATAYWYPTSWLSDLLPEGERVPTPIADEDIAAETPAESRFLHVGGHRAVGDRNGSTIIGGVIQKVKHPWRITSQDGMRVNPRVMGYTETMGAPLNRWDLYDGCGVLVYPRRYGGQSIVVNEAMARGLAVVMGDNPPNLEWPIVPVATRASGLVKTPAGRLQMHMVLTAELANTLHELAQNQDLLKGQQEKSLDWAHQNKWSLWEPRIRGLIEDAAS